ncbi:MAG: DNRLRE domain-containing protein [bacterium]|nr:DNRLRE domain-containing protein [bacterium]
MHIRQTVWAATAAVVALTSAGFPLAVRADALPQVVLSAPANGAVQTSTAATFRCSATDDVGLEEATLYYGREVVGDKTFRENGTVAAATDDTYISADAPNTNYGSAADMNIDGLTPHAHGLIKFPNLFGSGVDQVPPGAEIVSASLTFNCFNIGNTIRTYRLLEDWVESEATWNLRAAGVPWGNPGADGAVSRDSAALNWTCSTVGSQTYDLTPVVQQWAGGAPNHGVVMVESGADGVDFYTSEHATAANRPQLTVSYRTLEGWGPQATQPLAGTAGTAQFAATLQDVSTYRWNCQVRDAVGQTAMAGADSTLLVDSNYVPPYSTDPNLKVAFLGDQGLTVNSRAVLQMIKNEGAHAVFHQGDFDYADNPAAWDQQITDILGADFPYFASVGNHDLLAWAGYQQKLQERLGRIPGATCSGDLGVQSACRYRGLFFLLTAPGTMGSGHDLYLRDQLAADHAVWSVCSWHKNMQAMEVGNSHPDETGWGVYEECRKAGGMVATGHDHTYARTYLMSSFQTQQVATTSSTLVLEKGRSLAFVSGLGGQSIGAQASADPWFASIYTSTQGATYGALFCTFNVNGQPDRASCYFKNINGQVIDQFDLVSAVEVLARSPFALAGLDQSRADADGDGVETVTLDGGASYDSDGVITSYEWREGQTLLAITPAFTGGFTVGSHTLTLTVTDNDGQTGSDSVLVMVNGNQPPTANAGADQTVMDVDGDGAAAVTLDGSQSVDSEGAIISYEWREGELPLGQTPTLPWTFAVGTHTLTLAVADLAGAVAADQVVVTVTPKANQLPVTVAGPDQMAADPDGDGVATAMLDGTSSYDADGVIIGFAWYEGAQLLGTTATVTIDLSVGSHLLTLVVEDNEGGSGSDTVMVVVNANQPPTANAGADQTAVDGQTVTFDGGQSADGDGSVVFWQWDFGDGSQGSGAVAQHVFAAPGTYAAILTVTDNGGATAQDSAFVTVQPAVIELTKTFQQGITAAGATDDAMISASVPTKNYGTSNSFKIDGLNPHAHGLLKYPLLIGNGADQVPSGAEIVSATLTLNCRNAGNTLSVYRLLEDWVEGQATWNQRAAGVPWGNPGADGAASRDSTASNWTCATTGLKTFDATALVRSWVQGTPNFGLIMIETGNDGVEFSSSEYGTVNLRPLLTVTYRVAR